MQLVQQACPLWVPLVEAGELSGPGTEHFLAKYLRPVFDVAQPPTRVLLGCTHYPVLLPGIRRLVPPGVEILDQPAIVAERLEDWLRRHPERAAALGRGATRRFLTTDDPVWFATEGRRILGGSLEAERVRLPRLFSPSPCPYPSA